MSYAPDGKTLVTLGNDRTVRIWDISGKELTQLKGHQGIVESVSYGPDGKTLVTRGKDGTVRIWDTSGKERAQLKGHQGIVESVNYSPDSKTLATSGQDGIARIWDMSGKELAQLKGHQGIVKSVVYSPNGKTLATNGRDGTARIWDTSGRQIAQFDLDQYEGQGYVNSNWTAIATINSSPTSSGDQIVTLHSLTVSPTALLDRACRKLKYYILQSPELKDDRKMCGFEN